MDDDQVTERIKAAVESRVGAVRADAPELLSSYTGGQSAPTVAATPRRSWRWVVPVGMAAAAAVVLGVVVVAVGDDAADRDVAPATGPTTLPDGNANPIPVGELERWIIDAPSAVLLGAEDATTSATAIGANVYYEGGDGRLSGAVARTKGASIGLARSSWPVVETVSVLGGTASRYDDDGRELLVVDVQPPLIVETYGSLDAVALARTAVLADGVWTLSDPSIAEIGRRDEASGALRYSSLTYQVGASEQRVTVLRHPAGVIGAVLDSATSPAERVQDRDGTPYLLLAASSAILDRAGTDVVTLDGKVPDDLVILSGEAVLRQVDEATWSDLVASVRPDLGRPSTVVPPDPTVPAGGSQSGRYQAIGLVLEVAGEGVELCLGTIFDSLPPQCDGVPISAVEWRWPDGTFEEVDGVRWARYLVEGTYDGTTFIPTATPRLPKPDDEARWPQEAIDFTTPCPKPPEGWLAQAADAPTGEAEEMARAAVAAYAEGQQEYGALWIDQSVNEAALSPNPDAEDLMNDPTKYVLNVTFISDLDRHRAAIEPLWSGALCVSEAARSRMELKGIEARLWERPGILEVHSDAAAATVRAHFVLVTPELQAQLDTEFGPGVVQATSALLPVGE